MKAHLGRYDRADEALEMDYPEELLDDDGEPMSLSTKKNAGALEELQEKWKVKNQICYGLLMDVCWRNPTARKIAKRCKENNAKALLKDLQKRFQVIQDNVKQAETLI
jgi:hypothetical protein